MLVIGMGHRARQGKDTAALAMINAAPLELQIRQYGFADALKKEVWLACSRSGGQWNLIAHYKEAGLMPEWVVCEDPKPRTLLQWWGEWRRSQNPNYWVDRLRRTLEAHRPDVALITDVRHPNEIAFVKEYSGFNVKVTRTTRADIEVSEAHISERALSDFNGWDFYLEAAYRQELEQKAAELFTDIWETHGLRSIEP